MVTYSYAHYLLRANGSFGPTAGSVIDEWSSGFRLAIIGNDVPTLADYTPFLESVAPAYQTFHGTSSIQVGTNVYLRELTMARIGTDGKYNPESQLTTRRTYTTPIAGAGPPIHPFSSALVLSLRTNFPRGIGSNGRAYWPALGTNVDPGDGRISFPMQDNWLNAWLTLVNAINTASQSQLGSGIKIAVVGATGKTGVARTGHVHKIRMDCRMDSIERRENEQPPAWDERTVT